MRIPFASWRLLIFCVLPRHFWFWPGGVFFTPLSPGCCQWRFCSPSPHTLLLPLSPVLVPWSCQKRLWPWSEAECCAVESEPGIELDLSTFLEHFFAIEHDSFINFPDSEAFHITCSWMMETWLFCFVFMIKCRFPLEKVLIKEWFLLLKELKNTYIDWFPNLNIRAVCCDQVMCLFTSKALCPIFKNQINTTHF